MSSRISQKHYLNIIVKNDKKNFPYDPKINEQQKLNQRYLNCWLNRNGKFTHKLYTVEHIYKNVEMERVEVTTKISILQKFSIHSKSFACSPQYISVCQLLRKSDFYLQPSQVAFTEHSKGDTIKNKYHTSNTLSQSILISKFKAFIIFIKITQ